MSPKKLSNRETPKPYRLSIDTYDKRHYESIIDLFSLNKRESVLSFNVLLLSCLYEMKVMMQMFALLVGITEWKDRDWEDIEGAPKDVENMKVYLEQDLKVPSSNISILEGPKATRAGILSEFHRHLINNKMIQPGDPILFYYTGHGDLTDAPLHWPVVSDDRKIESLVPYDYGTQDGRGQRICGIPDRTIAALLEQLAKRHGDNITVILDCCHSGHGTRKSTEETFSYQIRAVDPAKSVPLREDVDSDIWSIASPSVEKRLRGAFTRRQDKSHVLLSACGPRENSIGCPTGGLFTQALLTCLRRKDISPRSYAELLKRTESTLQTQWGKYLWFQQHPQCEGVCRDRLVFEKIQIRPDMFTAKWQEKKQSFEIQCPCGVLGVRPGTRFEVYDLDPR